MIRYRRATNAAWPPWCATLATSRTDRSRGLSAIFCAPGSAPRTVPNRHRGRQHTAALAVEGLRSGGAINGSCTSELCPNADEPHASKKCRRYGAVRTSFHSCDAVFEKNGEQIPYRKVSLTREATPWMKGRRSSSS